MDAIYKTEFEHHSVKAIIIALNKWFGNEGKLPVKYFDTFIGYSDFCIDEPYTDKGHYYDGSTWDSNADCPNRPKNAAYAAIEFLSEEYEIFYSPQMEPDNDHKTNDELKARSDADYWFKAARERGQEIMKLRKEMKQQTKDDMDYILTAFREILDALKIDKSEYVAMDIPSLTRFVIMEAEKAASNLDNYREGSVKFAKDYSALQDEKDKLEKDVRHLTDWNADLERSLIAARAKFADILKELGVSRSNSIGLNLDTIQRNAIQRAKLIKSERDKYLKEVSDQKERKDDYERFTERCKLTALEDKVLAMYERIFDKDPNAKFTCACTPYLKLGYIETYISELETHNESLRKGHKEFREDAKDLKAKVDEMSRNFAFLNSCIKDLYRHVFDSTPVNMDELEMLQRIQKAYDNAEDRGTFAGKVYTLICDYCNKYNIKKPSSDLTLEECIADIVKRLAATLKENQDFRYEVEKLYVNMTDLQPSYRMTMLGILRAIAEDIDDRESEYCKMEEQWAKADKLRKEWCRKYESEHERANGEHKKADNYWAQIAGLRTRIKNLENDLNNAASNATGYDALKATLRRSLASEEALKKELDILRKQLKAANNERVLGHERLDDLDGASGDTTSGQGANE